MVENWASRRSIESDSKATQTLAPASPEKLKSWPTWLSGDSGGEVPSWRAPLAGPETGAAALEGRLRRLLPGGGGVSCFPWPCGQWVVLARSQQLRR